MIDISKGKFWDKPWSLVDGCTPCSPGCEHCWAAAMERRFGHLAEKVGNNPPRFTGVINTNSERLSIPLKRRKPTVYAVWNDLFHEAVPGDFINHAWMTMRNADKHTFLILTKRPEKMLSWTKISALYKTWPIDEIWPENVYLGLTVCNQQEADEKIPVFLQVPGKKFLSIEPMLGAIELRHLFNYCPEHDFPGGFCLQRRHDGVQWIDAVILGGETGPGTRPLHPDWVRSVRDQCAAAAVPFFLKSLGEWSLRGNMKTGCEYIHSKDGRLLDGRTHDDLPWRKRTCRVCGCTDERACEGGCSWVPDPEGGDLCSRCAEGK